MNIDSILEKVIDYKTQCKFSAALKLLTLAKEQGAQGETIDAQLKDLQQLVDLDIEKSEKERRELLQRRADCVNFTNSLCNQLSQALHAVIQKNPVELKADGKFTKKYAAKIDQAVAHIAHEKSRVFIEPCLYDSIRLEVKSDYAVEVGCKYIYASDFISKTSIPCAHPTDRSVDFYDNAEKEYKEKEKQLTELQYAISRLKRICEE